MQDGTAGASDGAAAGAAEQRHAEAESPQCARVAQEGEAVPGQCGAPDPGLHRSLAHC